MQRPAPAGRAEPSVRSDRVEAEPATDRIFGRISHGEPVSIADRTRDKPRRKVLKRVSRRQTSAISPYPSHVRAPRSLTPADADVLERRHARGRRRPGAHPAHARFRGRARARRGGRRRHPARGDRCDRGRRQGRAFRPRRHRQRGPRRRQYRHSPGRGAHRRGREGKYRRGRLRALGRQRPGRHRHRPGARIARRSRCADRRPRPGGRPPMWDSPAAFVAPPRWRGPPCSIPCRYRSV